jgi:hypothetical protein
MDWALNRADRLETGDGLLAGFGDVAGGHA